MIVLVSVVCVCVCVCVYVSCVCVLCVMCSCVVIKGKVYWSVNAIECLRWPAADLTLYTQCTLYKCTIHETE